MLWDSGMLDRGLEPHHCLYTSRSRWIEWLSWHAGCQEVSRSCTKGESEECIACRWWSMPKRENAFETHGRCHQKSKTGSINGPTKRTYVFQKFLNRLSMWMITEADLYSQRVKRGNYFSEKQLLKVRFQSRFCHIVLGNCRFNCFLNFCSLYNPGTGLTLFAFLLFWKERVTRNSIERYVILYLRMFSVLVNNLANMPLKVNVGYSTSCALWYLLTAPHWN